MRINLIPGFSQPAAVWDPTRAALPAPLAAHAVALDVPHGRDFVASAIALGDAGGEGMYVGYSMGGRLGLRLALDHPELVRSLVLVSASPGIDDDAERAARRAADAARGREIDELGVGAFLDAWLAQPIFATLPRDAAMAEARRDTMSAARLVHQMTTLGQGLMEPLWSRLGELRVPVTVVVGRRDVRYSEIGAAMTARIRTAHLVSIAGGHALPLEQPEALGTVIAAAHAATE